MRILRAYRAVAVTLMAALFVVCGSACAIRSPRGAAPSDPDQIFVQLREAARKNDAPRAAQLAARIPDYPAAAYLRYFQIKPTLFDDQGHARVDANDTPVLDFLKCYDGQSIADRMRNDYLLVLGARHDWRNFDTHYARFALDDDTQVACYALQSKAARDQEVANDARALLVEPKAYGDGCVGLIAYLAQRGQFSADDVWAQIRLALEQGYPNVASKLFDALGNDRPGPVLYDQAVLSAPLYLARGIAPNTSAHQLALVAITVMARNNAALAATMFASISQSLTPQERALGWGTIAYQAAMKQLPGAVDWYRLSTGAQLTYPAYEWRVRSALIAGDWVMARWSIEEMPAALRARPAWVYWHARALAQAGDKQAAAREYAPIASQFDFYGQLAAEALGQKTTIPPRTEVTDAEVDAMSKIPGFALAQRFYDLNLRLEGNREWNWPLRGMNDRQLLAAAEYARRLQLYDRTVNTADRTQSQHDFTLRYVSPFRQTVEREARQTGLDVEWLYGLIRQESRFIINARSGVGASGLMQLMPATAQMVAKKKTVAEKIGQRALSSAQMHDIDTNILLGTHYLSTLYTQLDSSAVLATAGYNAGPGRPRQWQQRFERPIEGAIFAETIPFSETRDYVKNVLSNATYYGALFEGRPQSLKARLGVILPGS